MSYQRQYYLKSKDIVDTELGFIDILGTATNSLKESLLKP